MRFRRRTKLFPGVWINFSKSGISTTIGPQGANLNFNRDGTFLNTGIPGTGLYDRKRVGAKPSNSRSKKARQSPEQPSSPALQKASAIQSQEAVASPEAQALTTEGLEALLLNLKECHAEREALKKDIYRAEGIYHSRKTLELFSKIFLIGFVLPWFKKRSGEAKEELSILRASLEECVVNVGIEAEPEINEAYAQLVQAFEDLISCDTIWDLTSRVHIHKQAARSASSSGVTQEKVSFNTLELPTLKSNHQALHMENANGGDLYLYPAFLAMINESGEFGLIDVRDLALEYAEQRTVSYEEVPPDAEQDGYTWARANKDGSPDRRFKDNFQLPICVYGSIRMSSSKGLNEEYVFSSRSKAEAFHQAFVSYRKVIGQ